jgi:hypothetical protein
MSRLPNDEDVLIASVTFNEDPPDPPNASGPSSRPKPLPLWLVLDVTFVCDVPA